MNIGISKKVIFPSLLFFIFFQSCKSADLNKINKNENNLLFQKSFLQKSNNKKIYNSSLINNSGGKSPRKKSFKKDFEQLIADIGKKQEELVIQSDQQSEINDVIYAEGNASASYGGKLIKAET